MLGRKRTVHKWSEKGRIVLCLLHREYERKFTARLWSYVFRNQLNLEGLSAGMPATRLDGQLAEMRTGGKGHELYTSIKDAEEDLINSTYSSYLQEIRDAIRNLKLDVKKKLNNTVTRAKSNPGRAQRRQHDASRADTSDGDASPESPQPMPRLQHFIHQASPYFQQLPPATGGTDSARFPHWRQTDEYIYPRLTTNMDSEGNNTSSHPLLLFRATPVITAFRSRRFKNPDVTIPAPPVFGSQEFKDIAWPHLQRDRSYQSPFVSFAQNPHNALRRVELARSEEHDQKMFLVIFTYNSLQDDAKAQFSTAEAPYLVRALFTPREVSDLPDGYRGTGEWLMYGNIGCEPIAVLDSAQAIALAKALRAFKAGDLSVLKSISQALQAVPETWKEVVAFNFLARYCGRSKLPQVGSHAYELLMETVLDRNPQALARLNALCERSATEDIEDGWYMQSASSKEDETTTTQESADNTPIRRPLVEVQPKIGVQPSLHDGTNYQQ